VTPEELNAYDILCNEYIVFTEGTLPAEPRAEKSTEPAKAEKAAPVQSDESDGGSSGSEADASPGHQDESAGEAETSGDHPAWPGSVQALADDSQPEGYDIKGNAGSMLYHVPGSAFYKRTVAEVWFDSEESAEAAGFLKPPSQRKAAESDEG